MPRPSGSRGPFKHITLSLKEDVWYALRDFLEAKYGYAYGRISHEAEQAIMEYIERHKNEIKQRVVKDDDVERLKEGLREVDKRLRNLEEKIGKIIEKLEEKEARELLEATKEGTEQKV